MIVSEVTHEIPDVTPQMLRGVERGLTKVRRLGDERLHEAAPVGSGFGWYRHRVSAQQAGRYRRQGIFVSAGPTNQWSHGGHMRDEDLESSRRGLEVTFRGKYRARFVNDGTGPHAIHYGAKTYKNGRRMGKRMVRHPGARANPFFERVLNSPGFARDCVEILDQEVSKAL